MSDTVDARGLSCPQPVIMTLNKIKTMGNGTLDILADTETSKENIVRAAESKGWDVADISEENNSFKICIKKG
ncbi:sulfurtransferase TusA family protein [Desulfoluna sp.]|uniref:sulfurtransferase TusA family protein n=1 Tax=Desulfoluna sp. TaxID=2045199 RepID=UPI00261009AB|nr:sulfurtransferase TusA family protein [Desulfoluna sp.]